SCGKALEEGNFKNLTPEQVEAHGRDLSNRMNKLIPALAEYNMLQPMGFGYRKKGSDDDFVQGVAFCREMSQENNIFVLTDPSLAHGPSQRRVLTDEELYDRYEVNEDWA